MPITDNTRRFTMDNPILFNGQYYPTTTMPIDDGNGNIQDTIVFADRNGNYFNQSGTPVMLQHTLPEVPVYPQKPTQEEMLANVLNSYLTMSNDKTKVNNTIHKQYNSHLNDKTIQGAKSNALWEKEHPNLDAWGKTLAAIPFAIAAAPAAITGGEALAGSAIGQAAINGIGRVMANPIVDTVNSALGFGMAYNGMNNIIDEGKFTPMTLLDLSGAVMPANGLTRLMEAAKARKLSNEARGLSTIDDIPLSSSEPSRGILAQLRDDNALARTGAELEERRLNPNLTPISPSEARRLLSTNDIQDIVDNIRRERNYLRNSIPEELPTLEIDLRANNINSFNPPTRTQDIILDDVHSESLINKPVNKTPEVIHFKARDTTKGELPYTDEEINALFNADGTIKDNVKIEDTVLTGGHGDFYYNTDTPKDVLTKHLASIDPTKPKGGAAELRDIMKDNPTGRSGLLIFTHSGDTSIDSTPLAYMQAMRMGKKFKPIANPTDTLLFFLIPKNYRDYFSKNNRILSNNLGYNNVFKESKEVAKRAKTLLDSNPNAPVTLLKDEYGNMTAFKLTDSEGDFLVPLRSRQEVVDKINKRLHAFNKQFGTTYEDVKPFQNNMGNIFDPLNPYPWDFGESFDLPNIYGIAYKKGGNLRK